MTSRSLLPTALLTAALLSAASLAFAQVTPQRESEDGDSWSGAVARCATETPSESEVQAVASYLKAHQSELAGLAVGGQIKVAWHVIYSGSTGNIPQSQIDAQIAELNKAYSGFYGGVNTGYTFVLASVSRTNNNSWWTCTPGTAKERNMKNALATDVTHRLNVYTCKPGQNLLGWSYFPNSYAENNKMHGVVFHYGSVPGGYLAPYNLGGTLDHEVGHYLGLYHTFQGGCTGSGDQVADTPAEGTATSGCPAGKNTCSTAGDDPIHNYMDYSDDFCYTQFTAGQDVRMDQMVPLYRPNLLNAAIAQAANTPATEELAGRPIVVPGALSLAAGPNPFTLETTLFYALPRAGHVSLKVYNVAGQLVETLVNGEMPLGEHRVTFRARNLPAGMYFTRLTLDGESTHRSVILVQ